MIVFLITKDLEIIIKIVIEIHSSSYDDCRPNAFIVFKDEPRLQSFKDVPS